MRRWCARSKEIRQIFGKVLHQEFPIFFERLKFRQIVFIFLAVGLISYANAIFHPFVHDDVALIQNNPQIASWKDLSSYFLKTDSVKDVAPIVNAYYRPFLEIFYKIEYVFFGASPYGYHFLNVMVHIANSLLIYGMTFLLSHRKSLAMSVAILFLVHPVQVEAVACISGISNLLYAFFCLLSALLYILSDQNKTKPTAMMFYVLSLCFFVLALLTKEQAIILPLLIFLYEFYFLKTKDGSLARAVLRWSAMGILTFGYLIYRKLILASALPSLLGHPQEFYLRLLSIPKTLLTYFTILVVPINLHYYRCLDILQFSILPVCVLGFVAVAVIYGLSLLSCDDRKFAVFGLGWFFLTLLPVLNIVPLIVEYSFIMISEHFLYFPICGFLIFVMLMFGRFSGAIFKEKAFRANAVFLCVLVPVFMGTTIKQNSYWRGEIPLFERTLRFQKNIGRIHVLLARAYYYQGEFDKAVDRFYAALDIIKGYASKTKEESAQRFYIGLIKGIHFDLAHCFEAKRDFKSALQQYQQAVILDPFDSVLCNSLGAAYLNLNRLNLAISSFQRAIELDPFNIMAMNNLALGYISQKEFKKAEALLHRALEINPNFQGAKQNLEQLQKSEEY